MDNTSLKLVSETDYQPASLKFERRQSPRHQIYARVTAVSHKSQDTPGDARGQICSLELVDMSATGVGAWSQQEIPLGSQVSVFIPAHGAEAGFDMLGKVVRSNAADNGYSIGILLESRMAA